MGVVVVEVVEGVGVVVRDVGEGRREVRRVGGV